MYSLKVLKTLDHPDGRHFMPGHDCHALNVFEVAELVIGYPEYFAPADDLTADLVQDTAKMQHYYNASLQAKE